MTYYLDEDATTLGHIRKRLETTDLIPSHQPLLTGIEEKFRRLERAGCRSIRSLRARLKNAKAQASLAEESGLEPDYLALLRRVVEGFFPKPVPLAAFDWIDSSLLQQLEAAGITNTEQLHRTARDGSVTGMRATQLSELIALADLSRTQWVSPTFARVLVAAGFSSAAALAKADAEALYQAVAKANEGARFYKAKVGVRDMRRLVNAASYVPA